MSFVKCFDIIEMVTDEATKQFSPQFRENAEAKSILREYCEALDDIAQEFDGKGFEAEVDESKMTISIKLECPDISINSKTHAFYELVDRAVSVSFSRGYWDTLAIRFVFPSIWEKIA